MLNRSNMACVAILLAFLPCFTQGAQPAAQSQVAFTPTLAFLRNPELFAAAKAQFGKSVVLFNEPLIKPVLHNEVRFGRTHVPFYHGQNMVHRLYQDFLQELYQELHQTDLKDFTFLRFWHERGGVDQKSAQEFIDVHEAGNNHRNWSDGEKPLARKILSVNYSLFGNVTGGSCSFSYLPATQIT
ncbi:MAG TPA: hypothetical protein VLG71_01310 [Candidatus Limnocylindria bacterium]|nr:hypothetical protein [Candidatus Limnocylindria bacterium]